MRRLPIPVLVLVLAVAYVLFGRGGSDPPTSGVDGAGGGPSPTYATRGGSADDEIAAAYAAHRGLRHVQGSGRVKKVLPDDRDGSPHQRFILQLDSGPTVLVAHNIDLAERIDGLRAGDRIEFSGEYVWNPQGGVLHWTHHDPQGRHPGGWLRHDGRTYQ